MRLIWIRLQRSDNAFGWCRGEGLVSWLREKRVRVGGEVGDSDPRKLKEQTAGKERYGASSLLRIARTHLRGRNKR